MNERRYLRIFLLVPALVILYFVFQIFRPFLVPVALAATLASLCYPVYDWIRVKTRGHLNLAALLTCLAITVVIVVPVVLLVLNLTQQVGDVYERFQGFVESGYFDQLTIDTVPYLGSVLEFASGYVDLEHFENMDVAGSLASALQRTSVFFLTQSTAILSSVVQMLTNFFIMVATMFFLFRDGGRLTEELKTWTPLSTRYEKLLATKFKEVARATVIGSAATALAQGAAGGLVFWVLGIDNALFWGSMMALFSLVPIVGTALIWAPWAGFLFATGSFGSGIALVVLAVFFVGMIDNVLRPVLIEGASGMHTMLVFFSIMGGLAYFGMVGMIFGPIIVALGLTFLELYKIEFKEMLSKPQ